MTSAILVRNLSKRYRRTSAVDDLTLNIEYGHICALLGSNGAGKTTTLNCVVGLSNPSTGEVLINGHPLRPSDFERLSFVPDGSAAYGWLSVGDHLRMTEGQFQLYDGARALELLERFRLDPRAKAGTLSKGQGTALSLVLAFSTRPKIIVLDEPTNGLDPGAQRLTLDLLVEAASQGAAVLMSSHQVAHVERVSDHVAILHEGRLVESGSTEDLVSRHKIVEAALNGSVTRRYSNGDADNIAQSLTSQGAQGLRVIDCSLEEIYLHAVGDQRSL